MFAEHGSARFNNPLATTWSRLLRRPARESHAAPAARPRPPLAINLIAAQRSQAIVDLRFSGADTVCQSAIVSVDNDAGLIQVDPWFPAYPARAGQAVTVSLRLGRQRQRFDTEVAPPSADGIAPCALRLPPTVGCEQRRNAYRLPLRGGRVPCAFSAALFRYAAQARDLSPLGIRLELREWRPLPVGSLLEDLEFELLGQHFCCAATVRNTRDGRDGGTEIGAAFIDLPRAAQRELERLVMQLQRRELRNPAAAPGAAAL